MTDVNKVYYGGVELVEAVNVHIDLGTNSTSFMRFELPITMKNAWVNNQFKNIQGYINEVLKFEGFIEKVIPSQTDLQIECRDLSAKLEQNILSQDKVIGTDFILFEGKVASTPASTTLAIEDGDGNAVTWTEDEYNDQFLIISQNDSSLEEEVFENGTNGYVGFANSLNGWTQVAGDYTDVTQSDGADFWHVRNASGVTSGYMAISLDAVQHTINKAFPLKRIFIRVGAILSLASKALLDILNERYIAVSVYAGTAFETAQYIGGNIYYRDNWNTQTIAIGVNGWIDIAANPTTFFSQGGSYWEGGYVFIVMTAPSIAHTDSTDFIKWYGLEVKLEYTDTSYTETNDIITSNSTGGNITCDDSEGNPINFNTRGVTEGDKIMIASSLAHAFSLVGEGVIGTPTNLTISYPTFTEGYGKRFNGIDSFEFWLELCKHKDLIWYVDYRNSNTLTAKLRSALTAESTALTGFNTWNITVENQSYSMIVIFWKNGYVTQPTNNLNTPLLYKETRKDLLTEQEAITYASDLATKFATPAYAIVLTYDTFIDVQVGYEVATITIDGIEYTNQMVRRVVYEQDSALGPFSTKIYLGRGFTPNDEAIGRKIKLLERKSQMDDAIFSSDTYNPSTATKHSDLQQILPTAASQYHLLPAEHALIHDFNPATKVNLAGANTVTDTFGLTPTTTNTNNLGTTGKDFKDAWIRNLKSGDNLYLNSGSTQDIFINDATARAVYSRGHDNYMGSEANEFKSLYFRRNAATVGGINTYGSLLGIHGGTGTSAGVITVDSEQAISQITISNTVYPKYNFSRYRASAAAVQSGDILGSIIFKGLDGSALRTGAEIRSYVTGAVGSSDLPADLRFYTTPDGSATPLEVLRLNTSVASAVNFLAVTNAASGSGPILKTDTANACDLNITCGAAKTLVLTTEVYDDVQFDLQTGKIGGANYPTWTTLGTLTSAYVFELNDYIWPKANEIPHSYKEGTDITFHVHIITNGTDADTAAKVQYQISYGWVDVNEVFSETSTTVEFTIAAGTADRKHLLASASATSGANMKIGSSIIIHFKRIDNSDHVNAHATYVEPEDTDASSPFVTQVGAHFGQDSLGSRSITTK